MRKSFFLVGILVGSLGLSGCANYQPAQGENALLGTVVGGVAGGLLGSTIGGGSGQVIATAGGAILGAIIGNHAGGQIGSSSYCYPPVSQSVCQTQNRYSSSDPCLQYSECADVRPCKKTTRCGTGYRLNEMDRAQANRAFQKAANCEIGQPVYWRNSFTDRQGSIRPVADGMNAMGLYCREFQTTVYVDGRAERMTGKACRTRDGRWVPVN